MTRDKNRKREPRQISRRFWYAASYAPGVLEPSRGGHVVVVDLDTLAERKAKDSAMRLYAKAGDELLACGPAIDDVAILAVTHVEPMEWRDKLLVETRAGAVPAGDVSVMKLSRKVAA